MNRRTTWIAALLTIIVAAGVLAADRLAPPVASADDPPVTAVADPVAGSFVCATGDPVDGTDLTTAVARPPGTGGAPAHVALESFADGEVETAGLQPIFPAADDRVSPTGDDAVGVLARWSDGPVAVAREWRWTAVEDLPVATVAGPCARSFSGRWVIPGLTTTGGNEAHLRLANPFRSDATVAVHFLTPDAVEAPLILQNVTVPARSVREIVVNDTLPERDDLAAVVEVVTGRVSAEGYQFARAEIGDVDGASLLAAAPRAAEDWTVPWIADTARWVSWLWIANPGDRTAPIELTLHTDTGGELPEGLAELSVPAGEMRRVDLRGTLPEGVTYAAVTVRSNGAPVVVSSATQRTAEEPADTGFAVQLGVPDPDPLWVVSGGHVADRVEEQLRIVNPAGDTATVDVALFNGVTVERPDDLQGLEVGPGSAVSLALLEQLEGARSWTAFVTATGGDVVVGRLGHGGGDEGLHLVAVPGMPSSAWMPDARALAGAHDTDFVRRLGTSLGLASEDDLEVELELDDPVGEAVRSR